VTACRFGSDLIAHCDEAGITTDLIDGITTASQPHMRSTPRADPDQLYLEKMKSCMT